MNAGELILVVDDEPAILRALSAALQARKHRVALATTGTEALSEVATRNPAVVILDLGLPDIDGIEVCRQLRRWTNTPIIVLTVEGAESRKVEALDEGADDYVTKPFSTPELLARVRVALRHRSDRESRDASPVLRVGEIEIDIPRHRVTLRGAEVDLTPKEFSFLAALARHPGRGLTHRMLLREVWGARLRRRNPVPTRLRQPPPEETGRQPSSSVPPDRAWRRLPTGRPDTAVTRRVNVSN